MFNDDRIRVTHVGSLARPPELQEYLRAYENGDALDEAAFDECLRRSVADVVRKQHEIGIDVVSDGEFGKTQTWAWYIRDRLAGFEERPLPPSDLVGPRDPSRLGEDRRAYADFYADYFRRNPVASGVREHGLSVCVGPIAYTGATAIQRDIHDLKAAMASAGVQDGFLPVVAPSSAVPIRIDEHYESDEEFIFALADALREEYLAIVYAGFILQIDDPGLVDWWDMLKPALSVDEYRDRFARLRIDAINHALKGIPEDRVRYHLCWGSWHGPHTHDLPFEHIVGLMLQVKAQCYSFEAANVRHEHEWKLWNDVKLPGGKMILPGVVSHSTNLVEHPELVADRIMRFAGAVGRENVIAGTDCGLGGRVHTEIAWAKLGALVEGARLASKALWR